ncbi:hypothetical protein ABFS83_02G155900 [Erythranthe nasuta]
MALTFCQESAKLENRPMMLKDFLIRDDCYHNSCSSSSSSSNGGFQMYPRRKPCKSTAAAVTSKKSTHKPGHIVLLRSWSRKAAAATRSSAAIHKVINVVKLFHFASAKSPLLLPRKLSKKCKEDENGAVLGDVTPEVKVKVKVKDILRWRSFRDVVEDNSSPWDFPSSPSRSTTTATATATTTTTSSSKRSSWCDSDFTAEESQLWGGENGEFLGKKCFTATNTTLTSPRVGDFSIEEYEQKSPVSVLDSPFQEVEEYKELINKSQDNNEQVMLLDFFMHEISNLDYHGNYVNHDNVKFNYDEVLRVAKSWVNGETCDGSYDWDNTEDKRESYVKDIEKGVCWKNFTPDREIVSNELEIEIWEDLVYALIIDFSN